MFPVRDPNPRGDVDHKLSKSAVISPIRLFSTQSLIEAGDGNKPFSKFPMPDISKYVFTLMIS